MHVPGYRIIRTIGKGGSATAYLAEPSWRAGLVVLKVVDAAATGEVGNVRRFVQEGQIVTRLHHHHVVTVHDVGQAGDLAYICMEYLEGGDLRGRIEAGMSVGEALEVVAAMAQALDYAHRQGLVHRDVKPANILFRADGTPVLADFGIAKLPRDNIELTTTGVILGSPLYMSPEQAEGMRLDGRSDLYSLGIILYEMLTGERPYTGDSALRVLMHQLQSPIPSLPPPLSALQPLLARLMAKRPEERFADAATLGRTVRALLARGSVPAGDGGALDLGAAPRRAAAAEAPDAWTRMRAGEAALDAELREVVARIRAGILEDLDCDRLVLPSLSDVALRVRTVLEDPRSTAADISRIIAADPALSAQVLRMANSAFYAGGAAARDVRGAVVRLGTHVVQHVVMLLVVAQLYNARAHRAVKAQLTRLWRHSTLVASLAGLLAKRCPGLNPEVARLAGLIHDIGALPVLVWAEKVPHLLADPARLDLVQRSLHTELGRTVVERWRYPAELVAVVAEHEDLDRAGSGQADYADVVLMANLLSHADAAPPEEQAAWWSLPAAGRIGLTPESAVAAMGEAAEEVSGLRELLQGADTSGARRR